MGLEVGWGIADGLGLAGVGAAVGLAAAGVILIDGEVAGDAIGTGVAADVQAAATNKPAIIVVAKRESGELISWPQRRPVRILATVSSLGAAVSSLNVVIR